MNKIKKNILRSGVILLGLFILVFCYSDNSYAQNKKYTREDMPEAVIESFNKAYPNAEVSGYDIELENGSKFYEIESKEGSIRRDILFNQDGSIQEIEESMDISELSQTAMNSIQSKYPGSKVIKAERVTKNNEINYEVLVKFKKKKHEVVLNKDGLIINSENMDEENEK
jgi:uncharacterized membrane protein YkoI